MKGRVFYGSSHIFLTVESPLDLSLCLIDLFFLPSMLLKYLKCSGSLLQGWLQGGFAMVLKTGCDEFHVCWYRGSTTFTSIF